MARKQATAAIVAREPATRSIINLKGSNAMAEWLSGVSRKTHIPAATIMRLGLATWAKANGHPAPPEK